MRANRSGGPPASAQTQVGELLCRVRRAAELAFVVTKPGANIAPNDIKDYVKQSQPRRLQGLA